MSAAGVSATGLARAAARSQPLRVLFVIPGQPRGSSMIFARRQAESLGAEGVEVNSFYLASRTSPEVLAGEWRRFRRLVREWRPDVVHAHFGTVTAAFAALAAPRIPLVITYRGGDLNPAPGGRGARLRAAVGRLLSQGAALRAEAIICVSRQLMGRLWWRRNKAVVLPSGVDPILFSPEPLLSARNRLGWAAADRVILFNAGHDPRVKRLDLARQAVAAASRSVARLRMEVLNGATDPDHIPALMNAADCLLLTSDAEGSPTVIQEALATNLPIVSVDVGDTRERLDGVRRTAIAPQNAEALGAALAKILSGSGRSDGRRKARECSFDCISRELKHTYERIVDR